MTHDRQNRALPSTRSATSRATITPSHTPTAGHAHSRQKSRPRRRRRARRPPGGDHADRQPQHGARGDGEEVDASTGGQRGADEQQCRRSEQRQPEAGQPSRPHRCCRSAAAGRARRGWPGGSARRSGRGCGSRVRYWRGPPGTGRLTDGGLHHVSVRADAVALAPPAGRRDGRRRGGDHLLSPCGGTPVPAACSSASCRSSASWPDDAGRRRRGRASSSLPPPGEARRPGTTSQPRAPRPVHRLGRGGRRPRAPTATACASPSRSTVSDSTRGPTGRRGAAWSIASRATSCGSPAPAGRAPGTSAVPSCATSSAASTSTTSATSAEPAPLDRASTRVRRALRERGRIGDARPTKRRCSPAWSSATTLANRRR